MLVQLFSYLFYSTTDIVHQMQNSKLINWLKKYILILEMCIKK